MKGVDEVASVATSGAAEDENTKVAEYARKAQEFAQRAPTEARSAAAPQVADSAPTGLPLPPLVSFVSYPLGCLYLLQCGDHLPTLRSPCSTSLMICLDQSLSMTIHVWIVAC